MITDVIKYTVRFVASLLCYQLQQVSWRQLQKVVKERGKEEVVVSSYPLHASALTS
jgi:hypothetical protein